MTEMTNEERAAYMRGYRASRRQDVHADCLMEKRKLQEIIAKYEDEIEILERLLRPRDADA